MNLQLSSVADKGIDDKERTVLKVVNDTDAGHFTVLQTGSNENGPTIDVHHTYWFPYKKVVEGDLIVLYTKAGVKNEKELEGGKTAHFFYWGLSKAIWSAPNKALVILHSPEWTSKMSKEF